MDANELTEYMIETNNTECVGTGDSKEILSVLTQKLNQSIAINDQMRVRRIRSLISQLNSTLPIPRGRKPKQISEKNKAKLKTTISTVRFKLSQTSTVPRQNRTQRQRRESLAPSQVSEQSSNIEESYQEEEEVSEIQPSIIHKESSNASYEPSVVSNTQSEQTEVSNNPSECEEAPQTPKKESQTEERNQYVTPKKTMELQFSKTSKPNETPRKCKQLSPQKLDYYNEIIDRLLIGDEEIDHIEEKERQELLFAITQRKNDCLEVKDYKTPQQLDEIYDSLYAKKQTRFAFRQQKLQELYRERDIIISNISRLQEEYKERADRLKEAQDAEEEIFLEDIEAKKFAEIEKIERYRDVHRKQTFPEVEQLRVDQKRFAQQRQYDVVEKLRNRADRLERRLTRNEEKRLNEMTEMKIKNLQGEIQNQTDGFNQRWDSVFRNLQLELKSDRHKYKQALKGVNGLIQFYERILREQPDK